MFIFIVSTNQWDKLVAVCIAFLGHIAVLHRCSLLLQMEYIGLFVCSCVIIMSPAEMAEPIQMPLGILSRVGPRKHGAPGKLSLWLNVDFRIHDGHFLDNIAKLKQAVAGDKSAHPTHPFADCPHLGASFNTLCRVNPAEVLKIIWVLPPKSSPLDFIPVSLIKSCSRVFSDIIATLANLLFEQGMFVTKYKAAIVRRCYWRSLVLVRLPLLTPSPTWITSQKFWRICLKHTYDHISPPVISISSGRWTKTALLHTLDNIYRSSDQGRLTTLVSIDLSSAFDMVEHTQ